MMRREIMSKKFGSQVEDLRTHTPPPSLRPVAVASIAGGPVKDGALSFDPIGPYSSLDDFEESLRINPNKLAFPPGWNTERGHAKNCSHEWRHLTQEHSRAAKRTSELDMHV